MRAWRRLYALAAVEMPAAPSFMLGDGCAQLAHPHMPAPRSLSVLGKERSTWQLVHALLSEELDSLGRQQHVPRTELGGPALPMSQSQGLPAEVRDHGARHSFG